MSIERWYQKANAYAEAWKQVLGSPPPRGAVVLGLAVAEHETRCGDSWPGENNWGAVQLPRQLTDAERAAIAGIVPHPNTVETARQRLVAAGLTEPKGALHADYSPAKPSKPAHYYFQWFARFDTEAEGAAHCVRTLATGNRASCRIVLTDPIGTEYMLAERMYATRYFEGFRAPGATYELQGGKWFQVDPAAPAKGQRISGRDLNVADYAGALAKLTPGIRSALASWTAGDPPPPAAYDLASVLGQQRALNALHVSTVPLKEDGVRGPKTIAAIQLFQAEHKLTVDGIVGPKTTAALQAALRS